MYIKSKQSGFSHVELVLVIVVITVIGFVGYSIYSRQQSNDGSSSSETINSNQSATANNVSPAPLIKTSSDLTKAYRILDQNDPGNTNTSDNNQLSNQLSSF